MLDLYDVDEKVDVKEFTKDEKKKVIESLLKHDFVVDRLLDFITIGVNYTWESQSLGHELAKPSKSNQGSRVKLMGLAATTSASLGMIARPFTGYSSAMARPLTAQSSSRIL